MPNPEPGPSSTSPHQAENVKLPKPQSTLFQPQVLAEDSESQLISDTRGADLPALEHPIPNSYWATPYLLASAYPFDSSSSPQKLDAVLWSGVRTFIDLTEDCELVHYEPHLLARAREIGVSESEIASEKYGIRYYRCPIPDMSVPVDKSAMDRILDLIEENEKEGRKTVVHCFGGIGRTGTTVGCWYVRSKRAPNGVQALSMLAEKRKTLQKSVRARRSPETDEQREFVIRYGRGAEGWEGWERESQGLMGGNEGWGFDIQAFNSMTGIVRKGGDGGTNDARSQ